MSGLMTWLLLPLLLLLLELVVVEVGCCWRWWELNALGRERGLVLPVEALVVGSLCWRPLSQTLSEAKNLSEKATNQLESCNEICGFQAHSITQLVCCVVAANWIETVHFCNARGGI